MSNNSDEDESSLRQLAQCRPLQLRTSQSVPILYRSSSSFDLNQVPGQENALLAHAQSRDRILQDDMSDDGASPSDSSSNDGDDDDDTFENACDIEDQASRTSFSMTSFSAMSTYGRSSNKSLAAESTSSDSEDNSSYSALFYPNTSRSPYDLLRRPRIMRTDSESGISKKMKMKNTLLRSDCSSSTLSSMGTFSKHKHKYSRGRAYGHNQHTAGGMPTIRQREQIPRISFILMIIKSISMLWGMCALIFLVYHLCIYDGPTSDLPLTPLAKLTPGNHNLNHIPFPPSEHKISVVLMNHSRPRMIKESTLVPTLLHHPSVRELVILHSNPKTAFKFVHPKVVNIDATKENDQMGLSIRFYFCQLVKSDWVLHVDDDMEFTEKTLNEMLSEFSKNTKRIVGRFGRNRKENRYVFH